MKIEELKPDIILMRKKGPRYGHTTRLLKVLGVHLEDKVVFLEDKSAAYGFTVQFDMYFPDVDAAYVIATDAVQVLYGT